MKFGSHYGRAITLGVVAAAIALAAPGSASAQRGAGGGGGFFNNPGLRLWTALDRGFERLSEELSLTEAQTDSVTRLVADFREENKSALGRWTSIASSVRSRARGPAGGRGGGARGGGGGMRGMQEMRDLMRQLAPALESLHEEVTGLLDEDQAKTLAKLLERRPPRG